MAGRDQALQSFVTATHTAIRARSTRGTDPAVRAVDRIFKALETIGPATLAERSTALPVLAHLPWALEAATADPNAAAIARSLSALAPQLSWRRRAGADTQGASFAEGHANAMLIGPGGLEERDDVWLGASLVAPGVTYPDHRHPPEEVYVVLSDGEWRQGDGPWHRPGPGGLVYNPPDIVHAMRAGPRPLLAVWGLWAG